MLSRVADALYWMMRYVERAENVARLVDVGLYLNVDLHAAQAEAPSAGGSAQGPWAAVLNATGEEDFYERAGAEATAYDVLRFMSFERENQNSILTCLARARETARTIREVISSEMWEQVNRAFLMVQRASQEEGLLHRPHAFFKEVKLASHLFHGLHADVMSHNEGWHFARAGGLIERADQGSRIVSGHFSVILPKHEAQESVEASLVGLLKSLSAYEMYRKKHRRITPERVLEFLLFDRQFPRSLYACLCGVQQSMQSITGVVGSAEESMDRLLGRLVARFAYADPKDLELATLEEFLETFRDELVAVDWAIRERFFGAAPDDAEPPRTQPPGQVQTQG